MGVLLTTLLGGALVAQSYAARPGSLEYWGYTVAELLFLLSGLLLLRQLLRPENLVLSRRLRLAMGGQTAVVLLLVGWLIGWAYSLTAVVMILALVGLRWMKKAKPEESINRWSALFLPCLLLIAGPLQYHLGDLFSEFLVRILFFGLCWALFVTWRKTPLT